MTMQDKYAVIAGASQGIGADISRLFAAHGITVIMLARNASNLHQVQQEIAQVGGQAHIYPMDAAVTENWITLDQWMRDNGLSCDILVNNAYWRTLEPSLEVTDESWDRTMTVSLKSYFLACRQMIPFMRERGGGSIVNISSVQSHIPEPNFGVYAVAKAGLNGLSRGIARDYGPLIRANTIVAGAVNTPGFTEGEEVKRELRRRLPSR